MPLYRGSRNILRAGYVFSATGSVTTDQLQATYEFPAGCMGANGLLEGNLWASCFASANGKRIRAFISNTNNGLSGTRFANFNISAQSATAVVGMRGFLICNKGSQSSQIIQPSASGGTGSTFSGFDFENLTIDTAQTFYITIALQKDVAGESFQMQMIRLYSTYIP
ncbi:MAG: hypothetical protein EB127_04560 [Alphaproteobacteria bacterium]|nr:hypothetical protein [Alphaproteobacteria bacterium]